MHFELSRREAQNLCYPPAMSNSHQKPIQFLVSPYGTISIFFTFCLTMKRRERRKRFSLFAEESEKQNVNFSWVLFLPLLVRSKNAKASIKFYLKGTRAPQFLPSNCFSNRFVFFIKTKLDRRRSLDGSFLLRSKSRIDPEDQKICIFFPPLLSYCYPIARTIHHLSCWRLGNKKTTGGILEHCNFQRFSLNEPRVPEAADCIFVFIWGHKETSLPVSQLSSSPRDIQIEYSYFLLTKNSMIVFHRLKKI